MSCGCGGGALPASVRLRMEAVRLSQDSKARLDAQAVYAFITEGVDVGELDAPPLPLAVGDSAEAVTSRNALISAPLSHVAGLDKRAVAALMSAGVTVLGMLVQIGAKGLQRALPDAEQARGVEESLERYGLRVTMTTDQLRTWVLTGPTQ